MTDTDLPADWALKEAIARSTTQLSFELLKTRPQWYLAQTELARMIEKYETPPVDPDLLEARAAFSLRFCNSYTKNSIRDGGYDNSSFIRGFMVARGK